jgi:hypothetical protein
MNRYMCLCGMKFRSKAKADLHVALYEEMVIYEGFPRHKLYKINWYDFISGIDITSFIKFFGFFILYIVAVIHFDLQFSFIESIFIGTGIGFISYD